MAFIKKIWKDRISEYPTRRQLTKENGDVELVTVARSEGTISQEGDAFSAENLNGLEGRIADGFEEVNSNLNDHTHDGRYYTEAETNDLLKYRPKSSGQNYRMAAGSIIVKVTESNSSNDGDGKRSFFNTIIDLSAHGFTGTPFFATATISGKQCGISYNYDNSNNAGIAISFRLPYSANARPVFTVGENIRICWMAIGN